MRGIPKHSAESRALHSHVILPVVLHSVLSFGQNDPAHFGRLERAMLTLFQVATLSSWGEIFQIQFFGCDNFDVSLFVRVAERTEWNTELGVELCRSCGGV